MAYDASLFTFSKFFFTLFFVYFCHFMSIDFLLIVTDGRTDGRRDKAGYRDARTLLKMGEKVKSEVSPKLLDQNSPCLHTYYIWPVWGNALSTRRYTLANS